MHFLGNNLIWIFFSKIILFVRSWKFYLLVIRLCNLIYFLNWDTLDSLHAYCFFDNNFIFFYFTSPVVEYHELPNPLAIMFFGTYKTYNYLDIDKVYKIPLNIPVCFKKKIPRYTKDFLIIFQENPWIHKMKKQYYSLLSFQKYNVSIHNTK